MASDFLRFWFCSGDIVVMAPRLIDKLGLLVTKVNSKIMKKSFFHGIFVKEKVMRMI
ncbi:hypothetical protein Hanom_Chr15g01384131 [Helianthus anomalus]